jgi:hypothetical protein
MLDKIPYKVGGNDMPFSLSLSLLLSTGEAILLCSISTKQVYESPHAIFPILPESFLLESDQHLEIYTFTAS